MRKHHALTDDELLARIREHGSEELLELVGELEVRYLGRAAFAQRVLSDVYELIAYASEIGDLRAPVARQ